MDEKTYEKLLKTAFREDAKTPKSWEERTRALMEQRRSQGAKKWTSKRLIGIVLVLALAIPAGVYAGFKLLSPADTALLMEKHELAEAFDKEEAEIVSKVDGDYTVSLLGMTSGARLDKFNFRTGKERNYVALAVQRTDGKPIEDYDRPDISLSPVIEGLDPDRWNAAVFDNALEKRIKDGVLYCIADWEDMQMFGYRKMYIAVMEDDFVPARNLFCYDDETGAISENDNYDKVNLLFEIKGDKNKADQKAAEEWIAEKEAERSKDDKADNVEPAEAAKDGITFTAFGRHAEPHHGEIRYWFNFFVDGEEIEGVYLECSRGTLVEPKRITEAEYRRLENQYGVNEGKDWYLRREYGDIYRFADYDKAASRIKVNHKVLTKEMYIEEAVRGFVAADDLDDLEIRIIVVKKDGTEVSKTAFVDKGKANELIWFKFK